MGKKDKILSLPLLIAKEFHWPRHLCDRVGTLDGHGSCHPYLVVQNPFGVLSQKSDRNVQITARPRGLFLPHVTERFVESTVTIQSARRIVPTKDMHCRTTE